MLGRAYMTNTVKAGTDPHRFSCRRPIRLIRGSYAPTEDTNAVYSSAVFRGTTLLRSYKRRVEVVSSRLGQSDDRRERASVVGTVRAGANISTYTVHEHAAPTHKQRVDPTQQKKGGHPLHPIPWAVHGRI
ncbi:unnamed protein product [Heligmosomoides polygyrus]|uniref:Uncharacterized protein n=1 Tax=Heligmosomoides polygyrus TaxID=6339 RepID=A0A183F4T4_HELPZ|nr:unnamed protein product [Heligmosomoides polygyrus]